MAEMDQFMQQAGKVFKVEKPGASLWSTFKVLAQGVSGVCWILSLPTEMLLHGRIGKRYLNSLVLALAIGVLLAITYFGGGVVRAVTRDTDRTTESPVQAAFTPTIRLHKRSEPVVTQAYDPFGTAPTTAPAPARSAHPPSQPHPTFNPPLVAATSPQVTSSTRPSMSEITVLLSVLAAAWLLHQFACWKRFRTAEQVHSLSNGLPWVLLWPN